MIIDARAADLISGVPLDAATAVAEAQTQHQTLLTHPPQG
jgi:hypothetical protein